MFGLREEIGGDPAGVAAFGQDDSFGGSSGKIDGATGRNELLGGGDVFIAGPKKFFNVRNGLCAVGERSDRLRAADTGDLVETEKMCCSEQFVVRFRADGENAPNTGNLRGYDGHEERGDK